MGDRLYNAQKMVKKAKNGACNGCVTKCDARATAYFASPVLKSGDFETGVAERALRPRKDVNNNT